MANINLQSALKYRSMGFSIIPVKQNKKPYIKWEPYQSESANQEQIRQWWQKWPSSNIGIVCGKISGLTVIDADSEAGINALNEFLPDSLAIPTVKTPHGHHFYFKHSLGVSNGVRVITDTDLRTDGGYIIAPPSKNGTGAGYAWLKGLRITEVPPPDIPDILLDILKSGATASRALASTYPNDSIPYNKKTPSLEGRNIVRNAKHNNPQQSVTIRNIAFEQGHRDDSLFYLANHLVKSGMPVENTRKYLEFIAYHCNPPFPKKEIPAKISSALKRAENRETNFTQEIRDWISVTNGNFSATFCNNALHFITSEDKAKARVVYNRLVKEGVLERDKDRAGHYRIVEKDCEPQDWQNSSTDTVDLWLPFELGDMVEVMPGDIILIAGSQNAGKSALLMNIAKENRHKWNVHYFSSELRPGSFNRRMRKFPDVMTEQMDINFYERSSNFTDVLKPRPGNLNLIDYLEIHDKFYIISKYLAEIHDKLNGAICIAAVQKDPNADYGRGGTFAQEKPVLSLALDKGTCKITKCKGFRDDIDNPTGKEYRFKLVDGCRLIRQKGWHLPADI